MEKTIMLLYHDIDSSDHPTEKQDLATRETVVRLEEFENHIQYLADEGYQVLSIKQFLDAQQIGNISRKDIVLTFDDGHISNYQFVLPILRQHSFSATFFIIAENIGKPYYMGSAELKELLNNHMEIGSHGLTHACLPMFDKEEIQREVAESKKVLETCTGVSIEVFAYPGGHVNPQILKSVKIAGYRGAASCIVGRNNRSIDPFLLRRIEVRRGTSLTAFQNALKPANILFFQCIDTGKSFMKKTFGLERYERLREKLYFLYPFKR